ncbi:MAG: protoporphyrinogen oxidase-like protein, partial [Candidatus Omnitrophica bacterium]|nr:protoporphyrinogen oxidase-like protein [Candidatus Omnitrophota bacterium]
ADHWLYTCDSKAGFHRVGFYNNVDISFLPSNSGQENNLVGLYVEKAFFENQKKSDLEIEAYSQQVVEELQNLGFIGEVEVIDSSWVPVAYTWSWPNSSWKKDMLDLLEVYGIYQVGRYGRWKFQGIAESIEQARQIAKAFF